jgi:hypothetical protein
MNSYDYNDAPASRPKSRLELWDILSLLVLMITLCIGVYFALVFAFPNSFINPLPPNPVNPLEPPTATITPIQLEPTWTPTPFSATSTPTLFPTITLQPSPTSFSLVPPTRTPSFTPTPKAPFSATVNVLQSDIIPHLQALGCNWQGVGGSVVDTNNSDVPGLVVRLAGTYNGKAVGPDGYQLTVSGTSPDYGKSGFEFFLGTVPISSNDLLFVQLEELGGQILSEKVYIDTFNDCKKNLVLIRFRKNR